MGVCPRQQKPHVQRPCGGKKGQALKELNEAVLRKHGAKTTEVKGKVGEATGGSSFFKSYLFIFGSAGSLLLHRLFSRGGEQGSSLFGVHKLLTELASLVAEFGLWACGLQQLQFPDSGATAVVHGLSCSAALWGSSQTRHGTRVPCTSRQILYP